MMASCTCAVPVHVQHVGNPRQGMPICSGIIGAECPYDVWPGKSLQNLRIARDIVGIIVIDEAVPKRGCVKYPGADRQQHCYYKNKPPVALNRGANRSSIEAVCRGEGYWKLHRHTQTAEHGTIALALLVRHTESTEVKTRTDCRAADLSTRNIRSR